MKRLLTPLAAACLLASVAPALAAAPYSGLYVFGDSLSDAGQFPDSVNSSTQTKRFTNRIGPLFTDASGEIYGQTSPMLLGQLLSLGLQTPSTSSVFEANGWADGNNWAVGGYRTDRILRLHYSARRICSCRLDYPSPVMVSLWIWPIVV